MPVNLFEPITINELTLANRIVISPMCQYSATDQGVATDWHTIHLGHLALSGAALLFLEATSVEPQGRITPNDLGLWSDECEHGLAKVLSAIRKNSPMPIAIQIAHAGRKASCALPWNGGKQLAVADGGWTNSSASPIAFADTDRPPVALDQAGLERVKAAFKATTERSLRLGLDAIEIHSAHGYLLHQFLSPLSNKRDDAYGGSLANRMRFPLEVFETMRAVVPARVPLGVRLSATDWAEGGWDLEQSLAYCHELAKRGCSFFDVSSGGLWAAQKIPVGPGYQVPFAEAVKRETKIPTMAVGMITEPGQAETIISTGQADIVSLARGMLYDPRWPWHAAAHLGATVSAPAQYLRSQPAIYRHLLQPAGHKA